MLTSQPLALAGVVLALSATVAAALAPAPSRRGFGIVSAVPAGFVLVCCWALLWGLMGGVVGIPAWGSRPTALIGVIVLLGLAGVGVQRRGGCVALIGRDGPAAAGFLTLAGFFAWVIASQPFPLWSRINGSGTDFLRHLGFIRGAREVGLLIPGEPGYPRALSALGGWLSTGLGIPATADSLWRAFAPLTFGLLALMLLSAMSTAAHLTDSLVGGALPRVVAPAVAGIAFIQTAWFSTFLAFGNVMNMIVGLALLAILAQGLQPRSFGSMSGSVVAGATVAVTANTWQLLLPVAGLAALPWFVQFLRRDAGHVGAWLVWVMSAVLTINGLLGLRQLDVTEHTAISTVSNLFRPDWWWWVALLLVFVAIVVAYRRGLRSWAVMAQGTLIGGVLLVAALLVWTGSSWELMRYYPVKALWTTMAVVIPLAATAVVLVVVTAWRRSDDRSSGVRLATRGVIALTIGLAVAGILGRGSAFPPHLLVIAQGRDLMPNWSMAVIDSMQGVPINDESKEGAIILGVIPSIGVQGVTSGFVGMADYMVMESFAHLGIPDAVASPVKPDLYRRDMEQICLYLKEYPESLRLTGPNPAAGPGWLLDSGCPEAVVHSEKWRSLQFRPDWLARSAWQGSSWEYPTVAEVEQAGGLRS